MDRYAESVVKKPLKMYCCNCLVLVLIMAFVGFMTVTLGESFLAYKIDVPIYLVHNHFKEVDDALYQARTLVTPETSLRPKHELERVNAGAKITLLYITVDGSSIYEQDKIEAIYEVEKQVVGSDLVKSQCLLDWPSEALGQMNVGNSAAVIAYNADEDNIPECVAHKSQFKSCIPMPGIPCSNASALPIGILSCENDSGECEDDEVQVSESFFLAKLEQIWNQDQYTDPFVREFYATTQTNFGKTTFSDENLQKVTAIKTEISLGLPLKGYSNQENNTDEQTDGIQELFLSEIGPYLELKSAELKEQGIHLWYDGPGYRRETMLGQLPLDSGLAIFSFIFAYIFCTIVKRSFWLATMAMGMILLSFFPSFLVYHYIFGQTYFGVFNLLCIYIVLGIGLDDVFVFTDTWDHSAHIPSASKSLVDRMKYTLRHAAGAMLVTSSTTVASFLMTARSSFPGISTFGQWSACLVFLNYILVITFYPTVVTMNEVYIKWSRCWCCSCARESATIAPAGEGGAISQAAKEPEDPGRVVRYFEQTHVPTIFKLRHLIVLLMAGLLAGAGYLASTLEVDPEMPDMFPDGHNLAEFNPALQDYFTDGSTFSAYGLNLLAVHGLQEEPIDRQGLDPAIPGNIGAPRYSESFDLRETVPCILKFCEKFNEENDQLSLGGNDKNYISCWAKDFYDQQFGSVANGELIWQQALANATIFNYKLMAFFQTQVGGMHRQNIIIELSEDRESIVGKTSVVSVQSDLLYKVGYVEGIKFLDRWLEAAQEWQSTIDECAALPEQVPVVAGCARYGQLFYQSKTLKDEAVSGIMMSLLVAFIVLTIFTGNLVVSTLASLCISGIVVFVLAFVVLSGSELGMLESINLVFVVGLSVDFVAHLAHSYIDAEEPDRYSRMSHSLKYVGISVLSGAFSTAGATFFLFFPVIRFFVLFGQYIFFTIITSLVFSLIFFPALMMTFGPEGNCGNIPVLGKKPNKHD